MKAFKLTKKMLSEPTILLKTVGAVNYRDNQAFPSQVFMNNKDYDVLVKNVRKLFKKENPLIKLEKLEAPVQYHMLNYGPVSLKNGIEQGYVLVDTQAIQEEVKRGN